MVSELDTRPNLLELSPEEFEHLAHDLLSRMGLETRLFRRGNDGGIDCVAYDPRPITGGKFVVQAKLYTRTVPPSAVRDLFGTVVDAGRRRDPDHHQRVRPVQLPVRERQAAAADRRDRAARAVPPARHPGPHRPQGQLIRAS